jgi:hypothetical protein
MSLLKASIGFTASTGVLTLTDDAAELHGLARGGRRHGRSASAILGRDCDAARRHRLGATSLSRAELQSA